MPKLSTIRPRIGTLKPLVATIRQTRDTASAANSAAWRKWYKSARWQQLRQQVLARDLYTCQQTGVLLIGGANEPDSPVVHHVVPHRGDERLFWDERNLQAVSKGWHDSEAQAMERRAI